MIRIREAKPLDRESVRQVHLSAFADGEKQMVAALAVNLLAEETSPPTFSLLAEVDGEAAGHVAFSPVTVENNPDRLGYILAPLGVRAEHQKRGIGSKLIERGIERLSEQGVHVVFVYGDPAYYGRFGFTADAARRFTPPYPLKYPFGWQAIALHETDPIDANTTITCVAPLRDEKLW